MKKIHFYFLLGILIIGGNLLAQDKGKTDTVYRVVQQMPSFKGNIDTYMRNHLSYPQSAFDKNIAGIVFVSFVITSTGQIKDIRIEKGVSPDLDSAAVMVLSAMPKWNPGRQNGVEVNVRCTLPVKFTVVKPENELKTPELKKNYCDLKGFYIIPYSGVALGTIPLNNGGLSNSFGVVGLTSTFAGGGEFGYMFNNHIGLFAAIQYQKYTNKYSFQDQLLPSQQISTANDTILTGNCMAIITYTFSYLQTPILFRYLSSKPGKIGLDLDLGVTMGFLLDATESGNVAQSEYFNGGNNFFSGNYLVSVASKVNNANKSDVGVVMNIGITVPVSNIFSLSFDVSDNYIFNSVGNGSQDIVTFPNGSFNYYQGQYGKASSIILNLKLIIRLSKSDCPKQGEKQ